MTNFEEMQRILLEHGIRMKVGGCGCCGSPWVKFEYKGEILVGEGGEDDHGVFDMFEDPIPVEHQPSFEERAPTFVIITKPKTKPES